MWARATLPMSEGGTSSAWSARVGAYQQRTEQVLDRYLTLADPGTPRLLQAMRYSVLGGGSDSGYFVLTYAVGD